MAPHSATVLFSHRKMLWAVTRNDLDARFAGSVLGTAWAVIAPLALLGIYSVVYLFVFRVSVPQFGRLQYVLYIFAGLVPYLATAEAISVGVGSLVASKSILNNTVFPIDLVPAKAVLSAQLTMLVGILVIVLGSALTGLISWTVLAVPLVILLHGLGLLGFIWILSALNVVFRDLQNLVNLGLVLLMVASPIAYTVGMVPAQLRALVFLNPLAHLMLAYQKMLVLGEWPSLLHGLGIVVMTLGTFALGGWFFARTKRVVADYV